MQRWREGYIHEPLVARHNVIFDHVPKTGGTTIGQALARLFPRQVSIDSHRLVQRGELGFVEQFPIVCGHFGGDWRRELRRRNGGIAFTVIREPVARVVSTYSYWRHNIGPDHRNYELPHLRAARTLDFAAFIRSPEPTLRQNLFNRAFTHLAGRKNSGADDEVASVAEHEMQIEALAAEFAVIGTTGRLAQALQSLLQELGHVHLPLASLLRHIPRNESRRIEWSGISDADRRYILERSRLDQRLFEIAVEREKPADSARLARAYAALAARAQTAWATLSRPSSAG